MSIRAVANQLRALGYNLRYKELRNIAVDHLRCHTTPEIKAVILGLGHRSRNSYLREMARDGTYGDNISLLSISRSLNIRIRVLSTLGHNGTTFITPDGNDCTDLPMITIGHLHEDNGEHYVGLSEIDTPSLTTPQYKTDSTFKTNMDNIVVEEENVRTTT